MFFSSTHVYSSYLLHMHILSYLHLHFCFSTLALSFFLFHSIFTATPTIATSENTVNKIPPKISSIVPKCLQIGKHKPTTTNTNTSPLPTTDRKTQTQTHIGTGQEIAERGWSSEVWPLRCRSRERKCEKEWSALGRGLVGGNG